MQTGLTLIYTNGYIAPTTNHHGRQAQAGSPDRKIPPIEGEEKNHVEEQREAIDARRRIGRRFDGVFIRGSRRRHKVPTSREDKYQPRRGVESLRRSAIK